MKTILVADDELPILNFVQRALTSKGYTILPASDGAQALQLFNSHKTPIDLVLSDIKMPMMDGIALALAIKSKSPTTPVILMTGYADQKERASGLSSLIEDVLQKPFELAELYAVVESALKI